MDHPAGLGGMPQAQRHRGAAGDLARRACGHARRRPSGRDGPFADETFGFDRDAFVHELVDSIIGDNYPVPDRMLVHNERIVREYLMWAMCGEPRPSGNSTSMRSRAARPRCATFSSP